MKKAGSKNKQELEPWRLRLRQALDARGLGYSAVSEEAGFNAEYVSKMLNGRINPTVDKILAICAVAGIEPSFLFLSDDANERTVRALSDAMELPEEDASLVARLLASARTK